ncbi:hypothetical protein [Terracidiphilus gabretensis]|uniref:hypothetical protein n=1 Tax=Terracidiphilus gabretensis TaxID=1577687 RepID=UPI00071B4EB5|nr:hypothetical protein [Terracidiphilus gabretensis]
MKRIFLLFSVCAVLLAAVAARGTFAATKTNATDITGTWAGDLTTPDGNGFTLTYTFKVDGAKLTGSVQGPQGDPLNLDNGKVDGDKFSFDVSFNNMTINNEGTVNADDTIKLSTKASDGSFPPGELTLKRVKVDAPAPKPTM